ncbi:MAG: Kae1-associated serine/threonine protein kinase, partial [Thaumarchaeota archaeon]|nr:Kae1-associated serine/threonine protein kinase [Nitrososphaerota archaeon]
METLIRKGAEADIYKVRWNGRIAVKKIRMPKAYRLPRLDEELRKRRTIHEATLISAAKLAGVDSPLLYFLDLSEKSIYMELFDGPRIKDIINDADLSSTKIFEVIGRSIG